MEFPGYPFLEELCLTNTNVKGDIHNIKLQNFAKLQKLDFLNGVYDCEEFDHVEDASNLLFVNYHLNKGNPTLFGNG